MDNIAQELKESESESVRIVDNSPTKSHEIENEYFYMRNYVYKIEWI